MVKTVILSAALALAAPALSLAHARLVSSVPAGGAQVAAVPQMITLTFSEAAKLASLKILVAGQERSVPLDPDAPAARTVKVPVTGLAPGGPYEVRWTAIASDDGHITRGSFSFTIATAVAAGG